MVEKGGDKKRVRVQSSPDVLDGNVGGIQMLPMREVPGVYYVHFPRTIPDILSFANDFPKLRENPVEWYRQTERFVKISMLDLRCIWEFHM